MFSKEAQELTKNTVEAIKKIAERQEKKCPECKGAGYFALSKERILADPRHTSIDCPTCKGTGKVKGKWEWEPEIRDQFYTVDYPEKVLYVAHFGTYWLGNPAIEDEERQPHCIKDCIPLLHWEDHLEPILEGIGYEIRTFDIQVKRRRWLCHIWKKGKLKKTAPRNKLVASVDNCKSRQEAVMKAVIKLAREE